MANELTSPFLIKIIPIILVNEGAACGPFDFNEFIQSPNVESGAIRFQAELSNGNPLPAGLICTANGTFSGIPAEGTHGHFTVVITAENDSGTPFRTEFELKIKARPAIHTEEIGENLKSRIWEALGKDLPLPEISEIMNRPVTDADIYYLLQRYATLTIWDVYNLEPPTEKHLLSLEGCSKHFNIYDRGSCLVAGPKELFSHERTLEDALQTARVIAREVYKRGWVVEFAGFDKMVRASWIELQIMGDKHGKQIEVLHYTPSESDRKIYTARANMPGLQI